MKRAAQEKGVRVPGEKRSRDPIENAIQLEEYVNFPELNGGVGAALLVKGKVPQLKFGFKVPGVHPNLSKSQFSLVAEYILDSIKMMPDGETITIIQTTKPDNSNRLRYFTRLAQGAPSGLFREMVKSAASPFEYFVNMSPGKRKTLARQRYKRKEIRVYVTVTPGRNSRTRDRSEAIVNAGLGLAAKLMSRITGDDVRRDSESEDVRKLFTTAQAIYEDWENVLKTMRLQFQPMTLDEMVAEQWEEFNHTPPKPLPQVLTWDGEHVSYEMRDDIHISSWLFQDQSLVPRAQRDFVWQQKPSGEKRVTGVVTLRDKPARWKNAQAQLKYLYEKVEGLEDYKIVLSFKKAPVAMVKRNIELMQRQALDAQTSAAKKNLPANFSKRLEAATSKAETELYEGNIPVKVSLCFLISKPSKKELDIACRRLKSKFPLPATLEIEQDYTPITWLQCFPQLSYSSPLFEPYNRARGYKASSVAAFMPIVSVNSPDTEGLEFITRNELTPFYIDIANVHRHILFLATTRAGKSLLFSQILLLAMCSNIPMVVIDYPKESGDSTFGPITKLAGEHGAYLNIADESNNFLEPPDLSCHVEDERLRRMIEVKDYCLDILMIIMFGPADSVMDREKRVAKSIFGNMLSRFYESPDIAERFDKALNAEMWSNAWANVPTLKDLSKMCNEATLREILDIEDVSPEHIQLINEIRLRFESFMQTTVGRSMSTPTSIPSDAKLLVFAFKGISNNDDAAILMASASAAAMRRTLAAPVSILFMDEASILSKFDALMYQASKIAANGAKSGIRLMMALQTPASIASSQYGAEIIGNMSTKIIGRILEPDADNYCSILKLPSEMIAENTVEEFEPKRKELYSNWLVVDSAKKTFVRSYAPPLLLAAVANNPPEEIAKKLFLDAYPDSPLMGLKEFAKEFILAAQEGRSLRSPDGQEIRLEVAVDATVEDTTEDPILEETHHAIHV